MATLQSSNETDKKRDRAGMWAIIVILTLGVAAYAGYTAYQQNMQTQTISNQAL